MTDPLSNALDQVLARKHSLVQNAADQETVLIHPVESDVHFVLHATVSGPNLVTRAPKAGRLRQLFETTLEAVEVSDCLLQPPIINGVVGYLDQVESCQL